MRVLFVCGFNTHHKESYIGDLYQIFRVGFTNDDFELFRYGYMEPLDEVRDRLAATIRETEHDLIVGHSMGCCLLCNLISLGTIDPKRKMIFVAPLLYSDTVKRLVLGIPWIENIPLLSSVAIPAYACSTDCNLMDHASGILTLKQVKHANDYYIDDPNTVAAKLAACDNLRIVYGKDDMVVQPLPESSLAMFPEGRVHFVPGKHDPFRAYSDTYVFWKTFERLLVEIGCIRSEN